MNAFKVSVVVPGFNEEENIPHLIRILTGVLNRYQDYEIIFVDDGSHDNSHSVLEKIHQTDSKVQYILLSRNFGHQNALKAGLDHATGDCVISMDADMQHPPELIPELVEKWQEGYDIVYTRRAADPSLPVFKRRTSSLFYRWMNFFAEVEIEEGTADFRLLNKTALHAFQKFSENDLFIRGLIKWIGFRQYCITYDPHQRMAGKSKYSFRKMFSLALKGITSFSIKPLRFSVVIGFVISGLAFLYGIYILYVYLFTGETVSGWTSVIISILLIGGLQLIILGVIGEYLGKLFLQAKNRPSYIVRKNTFTHSG